LDWLPSHPSDKVLFFLDNYYTSGLDVTYGAGYGALTGTGLGAAWTMGLYYALGDVTGSVTADPSGAANPITLGPLTLGTGPGSAAAFYYSTFGLAGEAMAGNAFAVPGTASSGGDLITLMIVADNGADYSWPTSTGRGHSAAFTMTTSADNSPAPKSVGSVMPGFSVAIAIPEPSAYALACLSGCVWCFVRRFNS
jgi:hypothetical protein